MTVRRVMMLAGAAAALACSDGPTNPVPGVEVTLAPGEQVRIAPDFAVRFLGVVSESRCPAGAVCVWAGDGAVALRIEDTGLVWRDTLHTTLDPQVVEHVTRQVKLTRLAPYPAVDVEIRPEDYRATLSIR